MAITDAGTGRAVKLTRDIEEAARIIRRRGSVREHAIVDCAFGFAAQLDVGEPHQRMEPENGGRHA